MPTEVISIIALNPETKPGHAEYVLWQKNAFVPDTNDAKVSKIFFDDEIGEAECFADPIPGSQLANAQHALHFRIPAPAVRMVVTIVPKADWLQWIADLEASPEEEPAPALGQADHGVANGATMTGIGQPPG